MPNAHFYQNLAEHFADFSVDKMMEIQNELDQYALYEPGYSDRLTTFNILYPITGEMCQELVRILNPNYVN